MLSFILDGLIESALAQVMPYYPGQNCEVPGLPGCGGPANVIANSTIPALGLFALRVASGLSVVCMVLAGIQLMMNWGDEAKISKQKQSMVFVMIGLTLSIVSQALVSALSGYDFTQGAPQDLVVSGILRSAVDIMLTVADAIFLIFLILYGIRMVLAQGKTDEFNRLRGGVMWTIIGAILVNISLVLVRVVLTFFGV